MSRPRGDEKLYFWARVNKSGDCWIWEGKYYPNGYGQFSVRHKTQTAHRWAYQFGIGIIPPNKNVCHKCDNPACVNPQHLFLGSQLENVHDMMRKGRKVTVGASKRLNEKQVKTIRKLYEKGRFLQRELAIAFGVTPNAINEIITRKRWRTI